MTDPTNEAVAADRAPQHPTIGLLVDRIEDSYQNDLFLELARSARDREANLLVLAGEPLSADWKRPTPANRIYEFAIGDALDALVVSAGTMEKHIGSLELARFLGRFRPLPICSVGVALPGVPSIVVDNGAGMREAVMHLIQDHGKRRIAFIAGPEANEESSHRHRGYLKALLDCHLAPDHRLVVSGDFREESGATAISELLDERQVTFDAVVAANDHMALGAMQALQARGIPVPRHVAVVGFDDVMDGQFAARPLTTVRQPISGLARRACDIALNLLQGKPPPGLTVLETELVTRRSCGCPLQRSEYAVQDPHRPRRGDGESPLIQKRASVVDDLVQATSGMSERRRRAEQLFDAFVADLRGKAEGTFLNAMDELCLTALHRGSDLRSLHRVISVLRRQAIPALVELPTLLLHAESLLHGGRVLVANMSQHREAQRRLDAARHFKALSEVAQRLITAIEPESLVDSLVESFPDLGIETALVAVHPMNPELPHGVDPSQLRVLLAYDAAGEVKRTPTDGPVPASQCVGSLCLHSERPRARVALPLHLRERSLGLLVLEIGPSHGLAYETLRAHVSAALEGTLLVEELAAGIADRKHLLRRITRHAHALQTAYRGLAAELNARTSPDSTRETSPTGSAAGGPEAAEQAMGSALEQLESVMAEFARLLGAEMDTLRPAAPERDSTPDA